MEQPEHKRKLILLTLTLKNKWRFTNCKKNCWQKVRFV